MRNRQLAALRRRILRETERELNRLLEEPNGGRPMRPRASGGNNHPVPGGAPANLLIAVR